MCCPGNIIGTGSRLVLREKRGGGRNDFWSGEDIEDFLGSAREEGGEENSNFKHASDETVKNGLKFFGFAVFGEFPRFLFVDGLIEILDFTPDEVESFVKFETVH